MTGRRPLSAREKAAVLAAALTTGLFTGDRFIYRPWRNAVDALEERILLREKDLRRAEGLMARADRLRRETAGRREGPWRSRDGVSLVKEAAFLARQSGVDIRDVRQGDAAGSKAPSVTVTVEAAWDPLARFLYELHRSPALVVEKAHVRARDGKAAVSAAFQIRGPEERP